MSTETETLTRSELSALLDAHAALGTAFEALCATRRAFGWGAGPEREDRIAALLTGVEAERESIEAELRARL